MKTITMFVLIASATAALWWPHAEAADPDCSGAIPQLTDCLDFVTNGSKIENPKPSCCEGIKDVLNVSPICLCVGLKSSVQLGVTLNITKALSLPSVCHISAPNSTCGLIPAPGPTPPAHHTPGSAPSTPAPQAASSGPSASGDVVSPAASPSQLPPKKSGSDGTSTASFVTAAFGVFVACVVGV